jgi:small-conductance mechanosensitive channel
MSLKTFSRTVLGTFLVLTGVTLIGTVVLRYWISAPPHQEPQKAAPAGLVDSQPLLTAQRLSAMATTPKEQEFAKDALRISDHEVDMAFAAALHQATEHAPPIPAAARPILAKVQDSQQRVKVDESEITRLKALISKAGDNTKQQLEDKLELAQATLEVDQEDLDALQQELIRAGGDPRSKIQQLKEQHEALDHEQTGVAAGSKDSKSAPAAQEGQSRILLVQFRGWRELSFKEKELANAREELKVRLAELGKDRQNLDEETKEEKAEEGGAHAEEDEHSTAAHGTGGNHEKYSELKHAAGERKHLAELDKRAADFQQLDAVYGDWGALVKGREHSYWLGVVEGCCWIVALLLPVIFANRLVHGIVARIAPDSRRRHAVRIAVRFAVQVVGVSLILLVIFGPPSQLATVLALAGAGLTVALKDFIVGFFGWFILMGPNGIRPGDWVEINGIAGEVVEVGLLHTVILETGNWSDAGHPTGRKVTVVNSFAIEGHYFNFSTSGQWLWDEIEVPIPAGVDPYPIAEAVHKTVTTETQTNIGLAEKEWQHAMPLHVGKTFSPAPAITVRPTTLGVNVIVRYITRANERHELRSRLFHQIVEVLRSKHIASGPLEGQTAQSAGS